ncbi:MAG: glycine cleavage system protein GcvH [Ignavibacteriales bacterium]|nr:glycine cleavage system protein GcvH [Ignavibacteriales bacterium]
MNFPADVKYTKDHEWVRVQGGTGTVGITEYAQGELGDVVFVELPAPGKKLSRGESFGTVEAVKAVSDLFSPVSGSVLEANKEIQDSPELVNKDSFGSGWMIKISIDNPVELDALMDAEAYKKLVAH